MLPSYYDIPAPRDGSLRPDRRPAARASEISLRIRRMTNRLGG
jgi:hypothetical protein